MIDSSLKLLEYKSHIIYKTICVINNKIYVGQHFIENNKLNDGYLGSGIKLEEAIKIFGRENFIREILEWCTKYTVNNREISWIEKLHARDPLIGYNIMTGGQKPDGIKGRIWIYNEILDKMRTIKEDEEIPIGWRRGKRKLSKEVCEQFSKSHKGLKPTDEAIRNSAEKRKGTKYPKSTCEAISKALKGKRKSKEHCKNMGLSRKEKIKIKINDKIYDSQRMCIKELKIGYYKLKNWIKKGKAEIIK
jgi:group I intron endonuclease